MSGFSGRLEQKSKANRKKVEMNKNLTQSHIQRGGKKKDCVDKLALDTDRKGPGGTLRNLSSWSGHSSLIFSSSHSNPEGLGDERSPSVFIVDVKLAKNYQRLSLT
ncbi:hypothetical protein KQX54_013196 [Cotesia glomerata]|uniref:Uncharacterized protein n=1 Tax=Cotesia glomerata TaxID=32391 RepID=A0AAV7J1I4_COTGL|nr:hypothetical protein KQX54_013196 [Cotesia glomerata]